jgi:hypothetical protein
MLERSQTMVTLASQATNWERANYLDEAHPRQPQAIGDLMQQLLSRYSASAKIEIVVSAAEETQSRRSNQVLGSTL